MKKYVLAVQEQAYDSVLPMIGGGFITIDGTRVDDHDIVLVVVSQELNAHWWCEIEYRDSPDRRIPAEERLGKDLSVTGIAPDGSQVPVFTGFVLESELVYHTSGSYQGRLRAVSWSYLMDLTPRREYYYQLTANDVAKKLAANNDLAFNGELDGPKLSYVQMGETDFHFLLRLTDESEKWLRPTDDGVEIQGEFQHGDKLEWRGELGLRHFSVKGQMSHPASAGTHYDYRKMQSKVAHGVKDNPEFYSSASRMVQAVKSSSDTLTDFSGERNRLLPVDDLQQRLKKETRRSLGRGITCWGASLQQTLKAGDEVEIDGVLDAQGTYGLIHVRHSWTDKGYENQFVCTPWKKYTGPHAPKAPRHDGIVAARVTDNNDPHNLGRLQVQYFWQESSHTCWLRMMTPHAGAGRGFMFLPEIGDEVWVMFEEGDPERARIIGSGWNGVHKLPREEFWGGDVKPNDVKRIVTKSGHRITIVDKPGKNSMVLATPNHLKISMIENSDETGDAMLALHSDGDIVLSAPNGRIHARGKLVSREVGAESISMSTIPIAPPNPLPILPSTPPANVDPKSLDGVLMVPDGQGGCKPVTQKLAPGEGLGDKQIQGAFSSTAISSSDCCKKARASGKPTRNIVYVNGIDTNPGDQCETLKRIARQTCGRVVGVYNATDGKTLGMPIKDLWQSYKDKGLIDKAKAGKTFPTHDGRNPAVDSLTDVLTESVRNDQPVELWAHSQGGAISSLAMFQANNELKTAGFSEGVSNIQVKSFASAAQAWPPNTKGEHYINIQDLVPIDFGLGVDPATDSQNAGKNSQVIRFMNNLNSGKPEIQDPTDLHKRATEPVGIDPDGFPIYDLPPTDLKHHDMNGDYMKMEQQKNGECSPTDS